MPWSKLAVFEALFFLFVWLSGAFRQNPWSDDEVCHDEESGETKKSKISPNYVTIKSHLLRPSHQNTLCHFLLGGFLQKHPAKSSCCFCLDLKRCLVFPPPPTTVTTPHFTSEVVVVIIRHWDAALQLRANCEILISRHERVNRKQLH